MGHDRTQDEDSQPLSSTSEANLFVTQEERLSALRSLANAAPTSYTSAALLPSKTPTAVQSSSRKRLIVVVGAGVGVVLILAIAIVTLTRGGELPFIQRSQPKAAAPISFFPALTQHLECPHDAAWSPDGKDLALVGYDQNCIGGATGAQNPYAFNMLPPVPSIVDIVNASTGASISTLHPDQMILKYITLPATVTALLGDPHLNSGPLLSFNYTHILWSRDGRRIAITFNGFIPTGPPLQQTNGIAPWPGYQIDGVVVMGADGANPQVLFHKFDPDHPLYTEWDLNTGSVMEPSPALLPPSPFSTIQAAARYQWGANGALTVATPLTSNGVFSSSTGSINGGASFALWQPGYAIPLASATPGGSQTGQDGFFTDIAAWSPDGRYLLERATVEALVSASATGDATRTWQDAPTVFSISAGLEQAFALFGSGASFSAADFFAAEKSNQYAFPVVWNPSGSLVAAYLISAGRVAIFDAKSGKRVTSFNAVVNLNATQSANTTEPVTLRWSPDGSRIFLYDPAKGAATIFPVS